MFVKTYEEVILLDDKNFHDGLGQYDRVLVVAKCDFRSDEIEYVVKATGPNVPMLYSSYPDLRSAIVDEVEPITGKLYSEVY